MEANRNLLVDGNSNYMRIFRMSGLNSPDAQQSSVLMACASASDAKWLSFGIARQFVLIRLVMPIDGT